MNTCKLLGGGGGPYFSFSHRGEESPPFLKKICWAKDGRFSVKYFYSTLIAP